MVSCSGSVFGRALLSGGPIGPSQLQCPKELDGFINVVAA